MREPFSPLSPAQPGEGWGEEEAFASNLHHAIAYYQAAAELFKQDKLVRRPEDSTPVRPQPVLAASP